MRTQDRTSADTERKLLGSILINNRSLYEAIDENLDYEHFSSYRNAAIWEAMYELGSKWGREVDLLTVKDWLERGDELAKVGGVGYLSSLVDDVPDMTAARAYATEIKSDFYRVGQEKGIIED